MQGWMLDKSMAVMNSGTWMKWLDS